MIKTKQILSIFLALVIAMFPTLFVGCGKSPTKHIQLLNCGIAHEQEFGGVYVKNTIEQFGSLGFDFGDSVSVKFSNGFELKDIPYYNGYYTKTGEPLLIGYPGYDFIKVAINNGDDLWDKANLELSPLSSDLLSSSKQLLWNNAKLEANMTATITLFEKGKYKSIQTARDIHYFDDRSLYPSNEVFANFRSLSGGRLKENFLFRSASPCDNQHGRANFVAPLAKKADVQFVINLADTEEKIEGYLQKPDFDQSSYFKTLYDNGKVLPLALNMNFGSDYFKDQTLVGLRAIIENDGPFLIHCTEGKDRTGFVCLLIEALAGATYGEIVQDYMLTYFNYYAITKAFDSARFETLVKNVLDPIIEAIVGESMTFENDTTFEDFATAYVKQNNSSGALHVLTSDEVQNLKAKICKN